MSQSPIVLQRIEVRPARAGFLTRLAFGAALASLVVVAFAGITTNNSAERVQWIRMGFELIALIWAAGLIASGLSRAGAWRIPMRVHPGVDRSVEA